jgi:hypothetical protein
MNSKLLVKLVRELVKNEVQRALPIVVESVHNSLLSELKNTNTSRNKPTPSVDTSGTRFSKNDEINSILQETLRSYSPAQDDSDDTIVLTTSDFAGIQGTSPDMIRQTFASRFQSAMPDVPHPATASRGGLGATTGVPSIDSALNRDYSQLVQRFKR